MQIKNVQIKNAHIKSVPLPIVDTPRINASYVTSWAGVTATGSPAAVSNYLVFTGTESLTTESIDLSELTNNDYTYEFWLRTTGSNGGLILAKIGGGGGYHVSAIELDTSGYIRRGHWLGDHQGYSAVSTAVTRDVWQHYTVTYNETSGLIKTYFNAQLVDSNAIGAESSPLTYGANPMAFNMFTTETTSFNYGTPLTCDFGEFRYYKRTLTAAEVAQNFAATRGRWGI